MRRPVEFPAAADPAAGTDRAAPRAGRGFLSLVPKAVSIGLSLAILMAAGTMATLWTPDYHGTDYRVLVSVGERFWSTGSPYADWQLTGPYALDTNAFIYPPTALFLVAPFAFLPAILWWAIPLGVLGWSIVRDRPWFALWPLLALLVFWPRTLNAVIVGGSDMWVTAGIALALRKSWVGPLLPLLKPSVLPLGFLGVRQRRWWRGVLVGALGVLITGPLWFQYLGAIANMPPVPLTYSLPSLPMYAIPIVSWLGRRRRPTNVDGGATTVPGS